MREGSILATQPAAQGNDLNPKTPLVPDVFPSSSRVAQFVVYDDDGHTYEYENGNYFRQEVSAKRSAASTEIVLRPATGTYQAHFPAYVLRVHQVSAAVTRDGAAMKRFASESAYRASNESGWYFTTDKFGAVTEVRVPAETREHNLKLTAR